MNEIINVILRQLVQIIICKAIYRRSWKHLLDCQTDCMTTYDAVFDRHFVAHWISFSCLQSWYGYNFILNFVLTIPFLYQLL